MKKITLLSKAFFALLALSLAACGTVQAPTFQAPTNPSNEAVATEVARLLTQTPPVQPVNTQPVATQPAPTQPPVVTATQPSLPTATTVPLTPTSTSTTVPLPTATPDKNDPRLSLGTPDFQDKTFKEGVNWGKAWEDDYTKGVFKDNQLVLTSLGVDGWTVSWPKVSNFYIEMKAKSGDCQGADRYGLVVRVPETFDTGYQYGITCDGRYSLRIWDPDAKQYINLVKWTHSDLINAGSGETNRLGLKADGDQLSLYINGHFLTQVTDKHFSEGRFGPFIGHDKTEDYTIYIQDVAMWEL